MGPDRGLHSLEGELHKIGCELLNKNRPCVISEATQQNNQFHTMFIKASQR